MFSLFTMNATKLATVCTIIETGLMFFVSDIAEELRQKFHDEYLSSVLENNAADK